MCTAGAYSAASWVACYKLQAIDLVEDRFQLRDYILTFLFWLAITWLVPMGI